MGLESVSFISELVTANPTGSDDYATADDHLRLLKTVLQAQFPNFTAAAMNATIAELNKLAGLSTLEADLELLAGADAAGLTAAELQLLIGRTGLLTQKAIHATDNPTKNNDGTMAPDVVLILPVVSGKYYLVDAMVMFSTTDGTKSLRAGFEGPGSITGWATLIDAASGFDGVVQGGDFESGHIVALDTAGTEHIVQMKGAFLAASTGNISVQWAQSAADAGWTLTRVAGSVMHIVEIG